MLCKFMFKNLSKYSDKEILEVNKIDGGGFELKINAYGDTNVLQFYGMVSYEALRNLEGKMLTIIDASFQDKEQRKAVKDIMRRTIWFDWVENFIERGENPLPVGMPTVE